MEDNPKARIRKILSILLILSKERPEMPGSDSGSGSGSGFTPRTPEGIFPNGGQVIVGIGKDDGEWKVKIVESGR